jgi:hypothetical protein
MPMAAAATIDRRLLPAPDVLAVVEAVLAGPGPEMAAVRDLVIDGLHGPLAMREYTPRVSEAATPGTVHGGEM